MLALAEWAAAAPPPLALVQPDGRLRCVNRAFDALPGDAAAAATSRRARAALRLAARRGGLRLRLEGAWSDWSAEGRPARAADGRQVLAVALTRTPVERDQDIERLMRLTAPDCVGMWRVDRRGRWRWASPRLGGAALMGQRAPDAVAEAARRGEGLVDLPAMLPGVGQGRVGWFANGGESFLLTARPAFDAAGRLDGLVGVARAACGRARAAQAFERMARAAAAADPGFALYDRDGRLRLASDGYIQLFDDDAAALSLGACAGDLMAEVTAGERRPPAAHETLAFDMTTSAGRRLAVRRRGGGCGGWTETALDVTPMRAAERAIEAGALMARQGASAKTVFLRSVAERLSAATRGLNQDLIALRAAGGALEAAAAVYVDLAEPIAQGFRRLRHLAGGVQTLNELEAPWAQIQPTAFDLSWLARAATAGAAAGASIRIELEAPEAMEIVADVRLVGLTLDQLLANAVKFTPAGGAARVAVARSVDGGVALTVTDTGPGVAPDVLERLTDPFFQVEDCAIERNHEGAGLGLSLCLAVMRLHGGRLEISNGAEGGFVARIIFPQGGHALSSAFGAL